MALYLAPAALGLGDLVVTLPVVQQLIARGESVYLVVRAEEHVELARRIGGLAGTRLEWEVPECLNEGDRFIDLRDHPLEKVAWWGSKPWLDKYPGWTIDDILGTICGDKGLGIDFAAEYVPLRFVRRPELADKILFVPGSAVSAKMWDAPHWHELARLLTVPDGGERLDYASKDVVGHFVEALNVVQPHCGERREPCDIAIIAETAIDGLPWYPTPTIADALDAVSSARAVIAVDTGIMHMAVHQGTPTVGLFRSSPVYARARDHFVSMTAKKACDTVCYMREIGCGHNGRPLAGKGFVPTDWTCLSDTKHCMDTITPKDVLAALDAAIGRRGLRRQRTGTLQ